MTRFVSYLTLGILVLLSGCSQSSNFGYGNVRDAINTEIGGGEGGTVLDVDGDGLPDALDTDGDGDPDVFIREPDPIDSDNDGIDDGLDWDGDGTADTPIPPAPTGDTPGVTPTPVSPPLRGSGGSCLIGLGTVAAVDNADSVSAANLLGAENLVIRRTSNSATTIVDLGGATLKRIIVQHAGNSNTVRIRNATLTEGFCNEVSGGSNVEVLEATVGVVLVDLISGSGNDGKFDILPVPTEGVKYSVTGNGQCVSIPPAATILSSAISGNSQTILTDGSTCL